MHKSYICWSNLENNIGRKFNRNPGDKMHRRQKQNGPQNYEFTLMHFMKITQQVVFVLKKLVIRNLT
jgi:hypothetical protein